MKRASIVLALFAFLPDAFARLKTYREQAHSYRIAVPL